MHPLQFECVGGQWGTLLLLIGASFSPIFSVSFYRLFLRFILRWILNFLSWTKLFLHSFLEPNSLSINTSLIVLQSMVPWRFRIAGALNGFLLQFFCMVMWKVLSTFNSSHSNLAVLPCIFITSGWCVVQGPYFSKFGLEKEHVHFNSCLSFIW